MSEKTNEGRLLDARYPSVSVEIQKVKCEMPWVNAIFLGTNQMTQLESEAFATRTYGTEGFTKPFRDEGIVLITLQKQEMADYFIPAIV